MKPIYAVALPLVCLPFLLTGCGGGGSASTSTTSPTTPSPAPVATVPNLFAGTYPNGVITTHTNVVPTTDVDDNRLVFTIDTSGVITGTTQDLIRYGGGTVSGTVTQSGIIDLLVVYPNPSLAYHYIGSVMFVPHEAPYPPSLVGTLTQYDSQRKYKTGFIGDLTINRSQ